MSTVGAGSEAVEAGRAAAGSAPGFGLAKTVAVLAGISFLLYTVAVALTPTHAPNSGSPGLRIAHYVAIHRQRLLIGDLLIAAALAMLMVFAASVYRLMRRAEDRDSWPAIAGLASAVAGAGLFGAGTAAFMTAAYRPGAAPGVLRALWDFGWLSYDSAGFAFAIWVAVVAAAALRLRVLPEWTVWVGIPVAVINLIGPFTLKSGSGAFSPQGAFALVVGVTFGVWLAVIAVGAWRSDAASG